jgi:hypothetical protein
MDEDIKTIRSIRRRSLNRIKKIIQPHFYESGYRIGKIGESRPLMLYSFLDKPIHIDDIEIVAITETGIATDAWGGGLVTEDWSTVSVEQLFKIETKLTKIFKEE